MSISQKDKAILRDLAKKQLEYANSPNNIDTIRAWNEHNTFKNRRPMIHLELFTFQHEVIAPRLRCEAETARQLETALYAGFLNHEVFNDDKPVTDYFPVSQATFFDPFGQQISVTHASDNGRLNLGHKFNYIINDLEDDFEKLGPSSYGVDKEHTAQYIDQINETIGDILPVKMTMNCLYSVPTQKIVHMMGMETMLLSMYDYPDRFHEMMDRYANDTIEYFRWLEGNELLLPTTAAEGLGQGTWCFTDELPDTDALKGRKVLTSDVWGFMDSQETVGISPSMFEEFIFPYYKRISDNYGLLSYGCCEPINSIWDSCLSKLENLRKVSISPWCDEEFMGERLRGKNIIFHRKPSPNFLGASTVLDEDAFRKHICKTLNAAKGCTLEITQRDVYTINSDESKARRYIQIIRDEIEKNWC